MKEQKSPAIDLFDKLFLNKEESKFYRRYVLPLKKEHQRQQARTEVRNEKLVKTKIRNINERISRLEFARDTLIKETKAQTIADIEEIIDELNIKDVLLRKNQPKLQGWNNALSSLKQKIKELGIK